MRNNIKTFTMFVRDKIDDNDRSEEVANSFRDLFAKLPTPITESDNGDLIIAVGGDGTFLDAVDLKNKIVKPFCTNEEGGFGIGELELRSRCKGAILKNGFSCKSGDVLSCDERLQNWLNK